MSTIFRFLIYQDRPSIYYFDINYDSFDAALYKAVFGVNGVEDLLNEIDLCRIFNDVHYIVTTILMYDHPELIWGTICNIANGGKEIKSLETKNNDSLRMTVVLGMVSAILEGFIYMGYDTGTEVLMLRIDTWAKKYDWINEIVVEIKKIIFPKGGTRFHYPGPMNFEPRPLTQELINSVEWEQQVSLVCDGYGPWEVEDDEAKWLVDYICGDDEDRRLQFVEYVIEYFTQMSRTERGFCQPDSYKAYLRKFYAIKRQLTNKETQPIDDVKSTKDFNLETIKDIVEYSGSSCSEKKAIIQAIYDELLNSGQMYKIPYNVDKCLDDLYKEYDESHRSLLSVYDSKQENLGLDNPKTDKIKDAFTFEHFELPEEFKTSEAELLMQKLSKAGLLTSNWQPLGLSIAEQGYLAGEISSRLSIKSKWKVMGILWNKNPETLRQGNYLAAKQVKTSRFIDKLKNILR